MAQDRLFQLDYLRRKAHGRLAEVLGKDGLETDIVSRTLGLTRIAEQEWSQSPKETRTLIQRFSDGINAHIEATPTLPIEFELLDYSPEPWSPLDCLVIATEFRSYLTVRLPIICAPELARRTLGEAAVRSLPARRSRRREHCAVRRLSIKAIGSRVHRAHRQ